MNNMTQGNPWKVILRFMAPVLLGNLIQLSYILTDTRLIGTFLGDEALAAVGSITVLPSLFMSFFMGIANGFAITIAQMFGAGKIKKVRSAFAAALALGGIIAVVMILGSMSMLPMFFRILNVPAELSKAASGYTKILLMGLFITMFYDILLASSRAIGDSFTPLCILIVSVVLNILGDILLLGVLHTDVQGAAAATVGAQGMALVLCAVYLLKQYDFFRINKEDFKGIQKQMVKEMLLTGISMGLMNSLINIGSFVLQTAINDLGNSYIVAQTTARKTTDVLMSVFVAMGQTLATYCGQNYGAGKYTRIRSGMKVGTIITCSWCAVVFVIVYLLAPILTEFITGSHDQDMIQAASGYLKVDCILYFLVALIFVLRNSLQGIGDRVTPLISSGIEMVGKIVFTYTLVPALGYTGVILVEPIVWIIMIIPLILKMKKVMRLEQWQN